MMTVLFERGDREVRLIVSAYLVPERANDPPKPIKARGTQHRDRDGLYQLSKVVRPGKEPRQEVEFPIGPSELDLPPGEWEVGFVVRGRGGENAEFLAATPAVRVRVEDGVTPRAWIVHAPEVPEAGRIAGALDVPEGPARVERQGDAIPPAPGVPSKVLPTPTAPSKVLPSPQGYKSFPGTTANPPALSAPMAAAGGGGGGGLASPSQDLETAGSKQPHPPLSPSAPPSPHTRRPASASTPPAIPKAD